MQSTGLIFVNRNALRDSWKRQLYSSTDTHDEAQLV